MSDLLDPGLPALNLVAEGALERMQVRTGPSVQYGLRIGDAVIEANPLIGRALRLEFVGQIFCRHCGRKTSKSFSQGYCYPCFRSLAACDSCIMSPEKCHFHLGTCREPQWGETHCMRPHWVYLANSSGLKVGITRKTQVPVRWMDQGAIAAIPLFEVSSRRIAGLIEADLRRFVSDRTNWRQMLKGAVEPVDLEQARDELRHQAAPIVAEMQARFGEEAVQLLEHDADYFSYPVSNWPQTIRSHNLDKTPQIGGKLEGIKGQYLMLDTGVINLRKFTAYQVRLFLENADYQGSSL